MLRFLKNLFLPNRMVVCRILRGPFRGARVLLNPHTSLRYIFGLYEHELNAWLEAALPKVKTLFDVGANHGYFSFGVMSAWRRHGVGGEIWAFEPQKEVFESVRESVNLNPRAGIEFTAVNRFVARNENEDTVALDSYLARMPESARQNAALVKIDVEGAEMDVLESAETLVRPGNLFLVEVHSADLLERVKRFFAERQHAIQVVSQQPLPILGREKRALENWWVVSTPPVA